MINNTSIANPNPGHYDSRTGLGYGQQKNNFHSPRIVSSGTHGIYNPKGVYDKEIAIEKEKKKKVNKRKRKRKNKIDSKINRKNFSSQFRDATDSLAYRGSDPFSFVGAAGAGHTTLKANHNIDSDSLLEQYIMESISAIHYTKKSIGNPYPRKNVTSDKASGQAASFTRGGSHGNYIRTGNRFSAGGKTVNKKPKRLTQFDKMKKSNMSLWDIIHYDDEEHFDHENVKYHNQKDINNCA